MAVTINGAISPAEVDTPGATSIAIPVPSGIVAGEMLVAITAGPDSTVPTASPTGWTLYKTQAGNVATGSRTAIGVWTRIADGTETGSVTFTLTGAVNRISGFMFRTSGWDSTTPFDVVPVSGSSASATTYTSPAIAPVTANALLLHIAVINTSTTSSITTVPAGLTQVAINPLGTGRRTYLYTETRATPGTTGTRSWALSPTAVQWGYVALAFRPSTTVTPKTYYVAANGSDTADGLSTATPWATIGKVPTTLKPGDQVLFRGGDTFSGMLWIPSGGTAASPVVIGSYGTGRATLTNTSNSAIYVDAVGGVEIRDLNVAGGAGATSFDGITFYKGTAGRAAYARVTNVDAYGWKQGLSFGGASGGGYSDVIVSGSTFYNNRDTGLITYGPAFNATTPTYAHANVTVTGCTAYDNEGNSANTATNTGSGIILGSVTSALVELSTAYSNGSLCNAPQGPAGIWTYDSTGVVISRCLAYSNRTGSTSTSDGDGFDLDINVSNSRVEYCLSYDNDGAGILIYTGQANTAHTGNVVRYNLCWGNSRNTDWYGEIKIGGTIRNCDIYGNTLVARTNAKSQQPPALNIEGSDSPLGITVRNNILATLATGPVVDANTAVTSSVILFQGNAYHRFGGTPTFAWGTSTYATLAAWRAAVANQETVSGAASGYVGDPGLTDVSTMPTVTSAANLAQATGFQLVGTSPVAQAGLDLPTLFSTSIGTRDYYGGALTAPYAVGAHEVIPTPAAISATPDVIAATPSVPAPTATLSAPGATVVAPDVIAATPTVPSPSITTTTPPTPPTLLQRVVGVPDTSSARVGVRTANATSVRLKVGTDSAVSTGVVFGSAATPDANGNAALTVSGLSAGTSYFYRVEMTDTGGGTSLDTGAVGRLETAPSGQASFAFAMGSCTNAADSASMAAIAARGDCDLFFHLGDLYYADASGTGLANFRSQMQAKITATNHAAVFSTMPTVYIPSDHDGMNNNTTAGVDTASATAWANWNTAYRENFPTPTLPGGTTGVYYTFVWGRVRFIATDARSFKSNPANVDNASKTALGATQKQWLKDTITAATEPVIVILNADPWIGTAAQTDDAWLGYTTERTELANFFAASGKNIVMTGGDMHAVAADDGTNSPGGVPIFHASPLNNNASQKGGPYTQSPYPASPSTAVVQQYGRVAVTDTGAQIALAFTGYSSDNTQRVALTKTYTVAAPQTATPDVVVASPAVPAPSVTSTLSATPDVIAASPDVPAPSVTGALSATPDVVAASPSVPSPAATSGLAATPDVIVASPTVPAPSVTSTLSATPDVVAASPTVPAPSVVTGYTVSPNTVAATPDVPAPTVTLATFVTPDPIVVAPLILAPQISFPIVVQAPVIAASPSVPAPSARMSTGQAVSMAVAVWTGTQWVPAATLVNTGSSWVPVS